MMRSIVCLLLGLKCQSAHRITLGLSYPDLDFMPYEEPALAAEHLVDVHFPRLQFEAQRSSLIAEVESLGCRRPEGVDRECLVRAVELRVIARRSEALAEGGDEVRSSLCFRMQLMPPSWSHKMTLATLHFLCVSLPPPRTHTHLSLRTHATANNYPAFPHGRWVAPGAGDTAAGHRIKCCREVVHGEISGHGHVPSHHSSRRHRRACRPRVSLAS